MAQAFRQTFKFPPKDVTHYFPGHMNRGLMDMQKKLKNVDCVVEIHDARISFQIVIDFRNTLCSPPY